MDVWARSRFLLPMLEFFGLFPTENPAQTVYTRIQVFSVMWLKNIGRTVFGSSICEDPGHKSPHLSALFFFVLVLPSESKWWLQVATVSNYPIARSCRWRDTLLPLSMKSWTWLQAWVTYISLSQSLQPDDCLLLIGQVWVMCPPLGLMGSPSGTMWTVTSWIWNVPHWLSVWTHSHPVWVGSGRLRGGV